jgi:hypothetical protein
VASDLSQDLDRSLNGDGQSLGIRLAETIERYGLDSGGQQLNRRRQFLRHHRRLEPDAVAFLDMGGVREFVE